MSEAWAPSAADGASPKPTVGISMNQAFSVDVVFRLGWAAVQQQPGLAVAVGGALTALQFGPQILQNLASTLVGDDATLVLLVTGVSLLVSLVAWVYLQFCLSGSYLTFGAVFEGAEPDLAVVFTGGRSGVNVLLAMVLASVGAAAVATALLGPGLVALFAGVTWMVGGPVSIALALVAVGIVGLLLAVPALIYVTVFLPLVPVAAALESVGPIDALGLAWERTGGARLTLFVLSLVLGVSQLLACCLGVVGLVPLLAVYHAGLTASWMLANRPLEELRKLTFFNENASDLIR